MISAKAQRIAGMCGIAFVVATFLPFVSVPPPPPAGASGADVVGYYTAQGAILAVVGWVGAIGFPLSMVFLGALVALFRKAEGDGGWLHLVFLMSFVLAIALAVVLGAVAQLLALNPASLGPDLAKMLSDLAGLGFALYFVCVCGCVD